MSELKKLLVAAKHALEYFDNHSDSFANSMTANELRQAIEAVEQPRAADIEACPDFGHDWISSGRANYNFCPFCGKRLQNR